MASTTEVADKAVNYLLSVLNDEKEATDTKMEAARLLLCSATKVPIPARPAAASE